MSRQIRGPFGNLVTTPFDYDTKAEWKHACAVIGKGSPDGKHHAIEIPIDFQSFPTPEDHSVLTKRWESLYTCKGDCGSGLDGQCENNCVGTECDKEECAGPEPTCFCSKDKLTKDGMEHVNTCKWKIWNDKRKKNWTLGE